MAEAFYTSTRGCVYVVDNGGGRGFYELEGDSGRLSGGDVFINGSDLSVGDIVTPVTTLDRTKILYSFGVDWGRSDISGIILLGEGGDGGKSLQKVINFWNQNRVSNDGKSCRLSVPGNSAAYNIYVHRLTVGIPDPQFHTQPFVLSTVVEEE